jgi:hypothetical protein
MRNEQKQTVNDLILGVAFLLLIALAMEAWG